MDRRTLLKTAATLAAAGIAPHAVHAQTGFSARPARPLPPRDELLIRSAIVLSIDDKVGDFARGDVHVRDGAIVAVAQNIDAAGIPVFDARDMICMPGFVDTQVNGGGGVLFNDAPTVEGIAAIGAAHRPFGTTAFLPTLISDTPDVIALALDAVDAAILAGVPGVLGIHIEGPVISPARKGIHDPTRFQDLDDELLALLTRPRLGRVMVTLAPERVTAAQIATLTAAGVLMALVPTATHAGFDAALAWFDVSPSPKTAALLVFGLSIFGGAFVFGCYLAALAPPKGRA